MLLAYNSCVWVSSGWGLAVESAAGRFSTAARCGLFINELWSDCGFASSAEMGSNPGAPTSLSEAAPLTARPFDTRGNPGTMSIHAEQQTQGAGCPFVALVTLGCLLLGLCRCRGRGAQEGRADCLRGTGNPRPACGDSRTDAGQLANPVSRPDALRHPGGHGNGAGRHGRW